MANTKELTNDMVWDLFDNYDVVEYIRSKSPVFLNAKKSVIYANVLKRTRMFSDEEILNGKADIDIEGFIKAEEASYKAILKQEEERKCLPIKPKKQKISPTFFKKLILTTLAGASIVSIASLHSKSLQDNEKVQDDVSKYIGMLASDRDSIDYLHKRNIVAQNSYTKEGDMSNTIIYNLPNIALDIIKVTNNDPNLFDLCILDTYFNLNYNRLRNMDEIMEHLKINILASNPDSPLQEKADLCSSFLDYVLNICIKRNLINYGDQEYEHILEVISKYKIVGYNALNDNEKNTISMLISKAKDILVTLGKEQIGNLENAATKEIEENNQERGI